MAADPEIIGAVVIWACLCSGAHDTLDQIPERCPGHDRARVSHWTNPGLPGGVTHGHDCPTDYRCPKEG